jgi:hypothetical protein
MAFGVIFDFKSVNDTRVTKGADMVKQKWFIDAVNYESPSMSSLSSAIIPFGQTRALVLWS